MEKNYIENKILNEIINKEHQNWNKDSINLLLYVFEFEFLSDMHNLCLMLFKDYLLWYKDNLSIKCSESDMDKELYKLEDLEIIYKKIDENLLLNKYENYVLYLKKKELKSQYNKNNENTPIQSKCGCPMLLIEDFFFDNFIWVLLGIIFFIFIVFKEIKIKNIPMQLPLQMPIPAPNIIDTVDMKELFGKLRQNFNLDECLQKFLGTISG